jgi:hypothetical protein
MRQLLRQTMLHTLAIIFLSLSSTACSENDESSLEITNPTRCVFPGKLQLNNDTKNILKQYQEKK